MLLPDGSPIGAMPDLFEPVPAATYNVRVDKPEYVAVPKSKSAKPYVKAELVIIGPGDNEFIGRRVFQNYPLTGPGSFRMRELLTVTGHSLDFRLTDTDQLLGLECMVKVVIEPGKNGYRDRNTVKEHLPLNP
jgi:hypothetical protein